MRLGEQRASRATAVPALAIVCILLISSPGAATQDSRELRVAVVQFEIPGLDALDRDAFEDAVRREIDGAVTHEVADLVVFPEYSSVFPTLSPFLYYAARSDSFREFSERVSRAFSRIDRPIDAFRVHQAENEAYLDRFWGGIAEEYGVAVIAGSYFAVEFSRTEGYELRNRMLLYDSSGQRVYTQDKVFPTPFEYDFLGLSQGEVAAAEIVEIGGFRVGFTICNDTFYRVWEYHLGDVDIWIDIKANNAIFTHDTRSLFTRALPSRVSGQQDLVGITVCLGGEFLDLFWEGPSSIVLGRDDGYAVALEAPSPDAPAILVAKVTGNGLEASLVTNAAFVTN